MRISLRSILSIPTGEERAAFADTVAHTNASRVLPGVSLLSIHGVYKRHPEKSTVLMERTIFFTVCFCLLWAAAVTLLDLRLYADAQVTAFVSMQYLFGISVLVPARFGGEEFIAPVRGADPEKDVGILERIRAAVEDMRMEHGASRAGAFVTVSVGGCSIAPTARDAMQDAVRRADEALYAAKEAGRNRAVLYGDHRDHAHEDAM